MLFDIGSREREVTAIWQEDVANKQATTRTGAVDADRRIYWVYIDSIEGGLSTKYNLQKNKNNFEYKTWGSRGSRGNLKQGLGVINKDNL